MLRETQTVFAASLLGRDAVRTHEGAGLIRSGKLSATQRLAIYRHNVLTNLCGVLEDIYPVVLKIVGEAFFRHAAQQFVCAHASHSGDLNRFGDEWPAFLGTYEHATDLPYLSDVARLEWAWHEAFHAGDALPFEFHRLAAVPPEEHGLLRFALHPTTQLLQSIFPILQIWQVNQLDFSGQMEVTWDNAIEYLLVHRDIADGVSVLIERVSGAGHAFLCAFARHATLEEAAAVAMEIDAAFDLQGFLIEAVQSGVIIDFIKD